MSQTWFSLKQFGLPLATGLLLGMLWPQACAWSQSPVTTGNEVLAPLQILAIEDSVVAENAKSPAGISSLSTTWLGTRNSDASPADRPGVVTGAQSGSDAAATRQFGHTIRKVVASLVLVLSVCLGVMLVISRSRWPGRFVAASGAGRQVTGARGEVVQTIRLGGARVLQVVDAGGARVVVAIDQTGIKQVVQIASAFASEMRNRTAADSAEIAADHLAAVAASPTFTGETGPRGDALRNRLPSELPSID